MIIKQYLESIKTSKLFKGFVATLLGSGFSKVILVLATFIFSHELSKLEFGEFSFVRNTLNTILCMCALNFVSLCTKFTVEAEKSSQALQRLFILFLFSLGVCAIAGFTLLFMPEKGIVELTGIDCLTSLFRLIGLLLPLFMIQPLMEGILRGLMRFKLIGFLQTITSILFVLSVYVGIKLSGLSGAVIGILIYYSTYSIISLAVVIKLNPFDDFRTHIRGFKKEAVVLKSMILPVFLMSFFEAPVLWVAQLLLSKYDSMEAVGSMTAIFQLRNIMILIPSYLFSTLVAFAGKMNADGQFSAYFDRFDKLILIMITIGVFAAVVCSLLSQPLMGLYGESYKADYIPFIISNIEIPFLLLIGLLKVDLVIQEHQTQLLVSSITWNLLWIGSFILLLKINISPLISFFLTQLLGVVFYMCWVFIVYKQDKKALL